MTTRAFIQEDGNRRLGAEERDLILGLRARCVSVEIFTRKRLERGRLPLGRDALVAGGVPVVLAALRQLGVDPPTPNDYPACLRHLLLRHVWPGTVRGLKERLFEEAGPPVFAKPSGRQKRFTGRVFASPDDLIHLEGASAATSVHYSEVVTWTSEHRVFVVRGDVVGVRHYSGDPTVRLDEEVLSEAISKLKDSAEGTAGYGLDLGVMADGRTALVEWNDGFSLGSYGLDPSLYTELVLARWSELIG